MREIPGGNDCYSLSSRESGPALPEIDVSYAVYFARDRHERYKCIYGYLPGSFFPPEAHLTRVPPHTFILYMRQRARGDGESEIEAFYLLATFIKTWRGGDLMRGLQNSLANCLFANMSPT